jgi:hypothetical protein
MSDFNPARPRYTLPFAGKDYELLGTFGLIEAVENATKSYVGDVAVKLVNGMPTHEFVRVLHAVLNACEHKLSQTEVGNLLWDKVGISGEANDTLRLHLYSFLIVCLSPPAQREQKAKDMGELLGKLQAASLGETTVASA